MINKILEDREKRYERVLQICKSGVKSVLCGKINCPGQNKNTEESIKAFKCLTKILQKELKLNEKDFEILDGFDGNSIIAGIDMEPFELKAKTAFIEESYSMGRVFDIDVYDSNGIPVSRSEINLESRTCIVCGGNAKICVREKKHNLNETLKVFNKIINDSEQEMMIDLRKI